MTTAKLKTSQTSVETSAVTTCGVAPEHLQLSCFQGLIDLGVSLPTSPGLYWITGENQEAPRLGANGVGKTSLLNALTWAATGKTGDGLSGPQVVSRDSLKKTAQVLVKWTDSTTFARTQSPNSFKVNGEERAASDTERTLGMGYEAWAVSVHHAQGAPFFIDLSPAEGARVLSEILELEVWDWRGEQARGEAKKLEQSKAQQVVILAAVRGQIQAVSQQHVRTQEQHRAQQRKYEEELRVQEEEKLKVEKESAQIEQDLAELAVKSKGITLRASRKEAQQKELEASSTKAQLSASDASAAFKLQQFKVRESQNALAQVDSLGARCKVCKQDISPSYKEAHRKEAEALVAVEKDTLARLQDVDLRASHALGEIQSQLFGIRDEVSKLLQEKQSCALQVSSLTQKVQRLQDKLQSLTKSSVPSEEAFVLLQKTLAELEEKTVVLEKEEKEQGQEVAALEQQVELHKFWGSHFGLLRLWLMDQFLQELTLASSSYLEEFGMEGWRVSFSTEKTTATSIQQKLQVLLFPPGTDVGHAPSGISGGEGTRVRLAIQMALSATTQDTAKFGFEIWDEPSAYLSGTGLSDMLDVLYARAHAERKVIYLVDHTVPNYAFDDVLFLSKQEGQVKAKWANGGVSNENTGN